MKKTNWMTSYGEYMKISDMTINHIMNVIYNIKNNTSSHYRSKNAQDYLAVFQKELHKRNVSQQNKLTLYKIY
jgi:hypothetical protein